MSATLSQRFARILVVDDEPAVLNLVGTMLSHAGLEAVTARDASDALRKIEEQVFDCVVTDALMPAVSGYDFVRQIRARPGGANLPILMLTRRRHRHDIKKALEAGVTDYIMKPVDEALLIEKVHACLDSPGAHGGSVDVGTAAKPARAEIGLEAEVTNISDKEVTIRSSVDFPPGQSIVLRSPLLEAIGLSAPLLKVTRSGPHGDSYEAGLSLSGLSEADLRKIRSWIGNRSSRPKS